MKSEPIYERSPDPVTGGAGGKGQKSPSGGQKVLSEFVIMSGSVLEGRKVMDINWPRNCLLVALEADGEREDPERKDRADGRGPSDGDGQMRGCRIYT